MAIIMITIMHDTVAHRSHIPKIRQNPNIETRLRLNENETRPLVTTTIIDTTTITVDTIEQSRRGHR